MKNIAKVLWMTLILGCSINVFASNEQFGSIVGGIAGGIIGNNVVHGSGKTAATIGGTVIGGLVGNKMGSDVDAQNRRMRHHRYSHWDDCRRPAVYPPHYSNTFIGRDGRLCRRSMLTGEYGDTIQAVYCCFRMTRDGYCAKWVRVD
jgi:hypothetical protein